MGAGGASLQSLQVWKVCVCDIQLSYVLPAVPKQPRAEMSEADKRKKRMEYDDPNVGAKYKVESNRCVADGGTSCRCADKVK